MDWTGAIAVLATPVVALATLVLANRHNATLEKARLEAEADADQARRAFQSAERRYDDRRDAVIAFDEATQNEQDALRNFMETHDNAAPGEIFDDEYSFPQLNATLARVIMLATVEVADAATAVRDAAIKAYDGEPTAVSQVNSALEVYRSEARKMLASSPQ